MFYSIEVVQPTGLVVIDTLTNVSEVDAFEVWENVVMDAHNGYEINLGHRGWIGLNAGDEIRLCAYEIQDGVVSDVGILYSETNSARANKRRTY